MRTRELIYAVLALLGLVVPWYFNLQYIVQGGNFGDVGEVARMLFANTLSSSFTSDLLIAFVAFVIFAPLEAARVGMRRGWLYPVVGLLIAFAFALPLFLLQRERHLRLRAA
jgi:hypothetical protein